MPADERQRVQDRMTEWARMTPDERGRARLQFQEVRQISPQDRQARWDAYLALPADERRALAKSASTVPPAAKAAATAAVGQAPAARPRRRRSTWSVHRSKQSAPRSVAPTVVQAKPGASTTLISKTATPPPHAQLGQPKIAATQDVGRPQARCCRRPGRRARRPWRRPASPRAGHQRALMALAGHACVAAAGAEPAAPSGLFRLRRRAAVRRADGRRVAVRPADRSSAMHSSACMACRCSSFPGAGPLLQLVLVARRADRGHEDLAHPTAHEAWPTRAGGTRARCATC